MTQLNTSHSPSLLTIDPLIEVVTCYQQAFYNWERTTDPLEKAQIHRQLQLIQEQLWPLINGPLFQLAKGWRGKPGGQELAPNFGVPIYTQDALHSLTCSLYLSVIEALPKLKVNTNLNLMACLVQIARRRLQDGDRNHYRHEKHRDQSFNEKTTEVGASWLNELRHATPSQTNPIENIPDTNSQNSEEQLIEHLYVKALFDEVQVFWHSALTPEDRWIVKRWDTDPPTPFAAIAAQLGPAWNESQVRQRHHRIIERTRRYLQERGLLESDP